MTSSPTTPGRVSAEDLESIRLAISASDKFLRDEKPTAEEKLALSRWEGFRVPSMLLAELDATRRERDEWKDEYQNVCKFATDYENQRDSLRAQLSAWKAYSEKLREALGLCICNEPVSEQDFAARCQKVAREALALQMPEEGK